MAEQSSEKQPEANNIEKMGEALGKAYSRLDQELSLVHFNWGQYVELFGTKPERVELMNKAAPKIFFSFQRTLWDSVLLSLTRLTDPFQSSRNRKHDSQYNLSVHYLAALLDQTPIAQDVRVLCGAARDACGFARDWRNRRIAHLDFNLALNPAATALTTANFQAVEMALKTLANLLNTVSQHYCNSTTAYYSLLKDSGAIGLLRRLNDGLKFDELRLARKLGTDGPSVSWDFEAL